ncbi:hypothetical protein QYF36_021904 [Acer negundo]|nr:hypothetical protein QYF36_021904 [Acer negundo]
MEEHRHLLQPLLSTTTTTSTAATTTNEDEDIRFLSSDKAISFRLLSIIFIGLISIYANYEQSKGFDIIITNDIKDSPAGNRFELFYVSNDKATRILQNTSSFVENVLYPDTTTSTNHPKKQVRRVTLLLSTKNNLTRIFPTVDTPKSDEFVINISPSIIMGHYSNDNHAMVSAIQRGMARVWLWDGESRAPPWLVDGLVEYMSGLAGFGGSSSWDDKDPRIVAQHLDQCEENNKGFIRRLNQAMRKRWDDRTVVEARNLCDYYKKLYNSTAL